MAQSSNSMNLLLAKMQTEMGTSFASTAPKAAPVINQRITLDDIKLDSTSSFEDLMSEAIRLSNSHTAIPEVTDKAIEKETLQQLVAEGMLDLSDEEIDLLFLKKSYPRKPELRKVPEGFSNLDTKKLIEDLKLLIAIVISILGVVASVSITAFPQAPSWAVLLTITTTGLAWFYTSYKVSKI